MHRRVLVSSDLHDRLLERAARDGVTPDQLAERALMWALDRAERRIAAHPRQRSDKDTWVWRGRLRSRTEPGVGLSPSDPGRGWLSVPREMHERIVARAKEAGVRPSKLVEAVVVQALAGEGR